MLGCAPAPAKDVDPPVLRDHHGERRLLGRIHVASGGVVARAARGTANVRTRSTVEDDADGVAQAGRVEEDGAVDRRDSLDGVVRQLGRLDGSALARQPHTLGLGVLGDYDKRAVFLPERALHDRPDAVDRRSWKIAELRIERGSESGDIERLFGEVAIP